MNKKKIFVLCLISIFVISAIFLLINKDSVMIDRKTYKNSNDLITLYTKGVYDNVLANDIVKAIRERRNARGVGKTIVKRNLYENAKTRALELSLYAVGKKRLDGQPVSSTMNATEFTSKTSFFSGYSIVEELLQNDQYASSVLLADDYSIDIGVAVYENNGKKYYSILVGNDSNNAYTIPNTNEETNYMTLYMYKSYLKEIKVQDFEKTNVFQVNTNYTISKLMMKNEGYENSMYTILGNVSATWTSSNPNIISVNENGVLSAHTPGTSIITADIAGIQKSYEVTVQEDPIYINYLAPNKAKLSLKEGEKEKLSVTYYPKNAIDTVRWRSEDNKIATVDSNGEVTAVSEGTTNVVAYSDNLEKVISITVTPKPISVKSVEIDVSSIKIAVGEEYTASATVLPENANNKEITWSVGNDHFAKVNQDGTVTGIYPGTTILIATANNGIYGTCPIEVTKAIPVTKIVMDNKLTLEVGESGTTNASIEPSNANNRKITWTSSDDNIASVDELGVITAEKEGTAIITARTPNNIEATCEVTVKKRKYVFYTTHVQKEGWQDYSYDGEMAGTSGKALRLEAIKIKLHKQKYLGNIIYRTHIQSYGWEKEFKKNDEVSGTSGEAKRLEAIEVKLDGEMANHYDIYYRVHAQKFGWLGWARNGEEAGTAGYAYRLEAIQIKIVEKDSEFADYGKEVAFKEKNAVESFTLNKTNISLEVDDTANLTATILPTTATNKTITWTSDNESSATVDANGKVTAVGEGTATITAKTSNGRQATCSVNVLPPIPGVAYQTHVQSYGWQDYVKNGEMSGTSGEAKRLEGIKIKLRHPEYSGDILYRTHIQSYGWEEKFKKNDEFSGTSGEAKRLEAIEIKLSGEMEEHFDIYYRVHAQSFGWLNWAKNGERSGTAGYAKRLEGIEIVLVEKGGQPPERSNQNDERSYIEK